MRWWGVGQIAKILGVLSFDETTGKEDAVLRQPNDDVVRGVAGPGKEDFNVLSRNVQRGAVVELRGGY